MRFLRITVLLLVVVAAFAVASTAGAAGNGSVSIVPASSNALPGGTVNIDVIVDPPSIGTTIWIIRVTYDPAVVQYLSCSPMADPGSGVGFAFSASCDNVTPDAVAFGGWVENQGGIPHGFETPQRAGTFAFRAIGPPGSQSPLHITVQSMLGPNGEEEHPTTNDGVIHVVAPAVGGTVEVLTPGPGASAIPSAGWLALAFVVPLAVAAAMRRRIIGR